MAQSEPFPEFVKLCLGRSGPSLWGRRDLIGPVESAFTGCVGCNRTISSWLTRGLYCVICFWANLWAHHLSLPRLFSKLHVVPVPFPPSPTFLSSRRIVHCAMAPQFPYDVEILRNGADAGDNGVGFCKELHHASMLYPHGDYDQNYD